MPAPPTALSTEVCILGAGPHGLAAAIHLRRARPDLHVTTIDPSGAWLAGWHEQLARAEIEVLRSPIVHHPAPDPFELTDYIDRHDLPRSGLPYDPPTAGVFTSFCLEMLAASELENPVPARAEVIRRHGSGVAVITEGAEIWADHLIVATNPHRRSIPDWVWPLLGSRPGLLRFGTDVDLRSHHDLKGRQVVIVGGGLTAAHLACGAAKRGAEVHLVTRRPLDTRSFDTDPGWLGPRFLDAFASEDDPARRLHTARAARGGGTIPPWMRSAVEALVHDGQIVPHEGHCVRAADVDRAGNCVLAIDDQTTLEPDEIWLATGTIPDVRAARCLADLADDAPVVDGLPVIDENLRLGPHPVHVMGRLATLTLGPAAGNLWGAQRAATLITRALTGVDLEHESVVPTQPSRTSSDRGRP